MSDTSTAKGGRRFPIGLTVATAISLAILIGLGSWQVQRLHWKQDLLQRIAERSHAAPMPIRQAFEKFANTDAEFARVTLDCPGLATAPFVELYAIEDGQAGSRLISACPVGEAPYNVLVDRGFVADTISARPPVSPSTDVIQVTGVVRRSDKPRTFTPPTAGNRYFSRDIPAMAEGLKIGGRHWADMVVAETSSNPDWKALRPLPLPTEISNRHLEYALTWFGLAGALVAVYAALLRRRWKS